MTDFTETKLQKDTIVESQNTGYKVAQRYWDKCHIWDQLWFNSGGRGG